MRIHLVLPISLLQNLITCMPEKNHLSQHNLSMEIHRCRFVDYTPHVITALAFSHVSDKSKGAPSNLRLAVGRSNGDIEIWNPKYGWLHEMTLPGARGRTVEGLVWANSGDENPRLFSIGGSTYITEWDLTTGRPKTNLNCNAGVIWCADANASGTHLAVGCDDGSVVIVDISGGSGLIEFDFICQRQDQRVLGLRWYGDDLLIGGCADGKIRCWSAKGDAKGKIVHTMKVDKLKTESTLVWSILTLPKRNQFVTGDSTGSVKVWDATNFTLIQSFATHEADVLTLTKDFDEEKIFSAGIDRKIHQFSWLLNKSKKSARWIHNFSRLLHSNDVRSLVSFESRAYSFLISGGVERSVIVQFIDRFQDGPYKKLILDQQISNIRASFENNLIALFQDQTVKVWRVADDKHKLVAKVVLSDEDNVTSVSIGEMKDNKCVMAVATINSVKVFWLEAQERKLLVKKIRDRNDGLESVVSGAKNVLVKDINQLFIHTPEDGIFKFTVHDEGIEFDDEIELLGEPRNFRKAGLDYASCIRSIAISNDMSILAVAKYNSTVQIVSLENNEPYRLATLANNVNLMEITERRTLVVLAEDNKLFEFNIEKGAPNLLTTWSSKNSDFMPLSFVKLDQKPQGMFSQGDKVWIFGSTWLCFFDLSVNLEISKSHLLKSKKRTNDGLSIRDAEDLDREVGDEDAFDKELTVIAAQRVRQGDDSTSQNAFWLTQKYRMIIKICPWGDNDIMVVERDLFSLPATAAFEAPLLRV